jgi:hypothetical protein
MRKTRLGAVHHVTRQDGFLVLLAGIENVAGVSGVFRIGTLRLPLGRFSLEVAVFSRQTLAMQWLQQIY